jgi:hypothetical protein
MIPKKLVPGLDPGMETGFRVRSCASIIHDPEKLVPGLDPGMAIGMAKSGMIGLPTRRDGASCR